MMHRELISDEDWLKISHDDRREVYISYYRDFPSPITAKIRNLFDRANIKELPNVTCCHDAIYFGLIYQDRYDPLIKELLRTLHDRYYSVTHAINDITKDHLLYAVPFKKVKVTLTLDFEDWMTLTINGKNRACFDKTVVLYFNTIEEAIKNLELNQIESFTSHKVSKLFKH